VLLMSKEFPTYYENIIDKFVSVDTSDYSQTIDKVKQLSKEFHLAGVAAFTETAVEICSYIAHELNLPGNPIESIKFARNKLAMREQLAKANVEQVPFFHLKDINKLEEGISSIGLPVIVKPINSSGSIGIFHIKSNEDIRTFLINYSHINNAKYDPFSRTNTTEFIIEKYITGHEVSVEGLIFNKEVMICGITDKSTTMDYKIEYQHIFPSNLPEAEQCVIQKSVEMIITVLGFDYCSFHLEGKLYNNKFYMIEVAARPAGGYIASHLIPNATSQNYYNDLVNIIIGHRPTSKYIAKCYSGIRFILAPKEGIFTSINNWSYLTQHPLVNSFFIETDIGARILLPPKDYRLLRLFAFIINGASYKEVSNTLLTLSNKATPVIQELI